MTITPQPIRFALFGAGRVGSLFAEYLQSQPQAHLAYVVDSNAEKLKKFECENPSCHAQFLSDVDTKRVLDDENITATVVTTPAVVNNNLVISSLNAHKSVFLQKPMSTDASHVTQWFSLSEKVGKKLICGYNRRYDQCFMNARNTVKHGGLGDLHVIKTVSRDANLPSIDHLKQSGGIFRDVVCADIDAICWMANEYPVSVYAIGYAHRHKVNQIGDYDTVAVTLKFKSGLIGEIDVGRNASYGFDQRMEIVGEKGMIQVENIPQCFTTIYTNDGHISPKLICPPTDRYKTAYQRQFHQFLHDINNGDNTSKVDPSNISAVSRITDACIKSAKEENVQRVTGSVIE